MRDVPECLNRRYKALDELIKEISTQKYSNHCSSDDPGIKLMCDFWNILKEDPNVDLTQAVQQRMGMNTHSNSKFGHQQVSCYMAGCCNRNEDKKQESKPKHTCGRQNTDSAKSNSSQQANESLPLNNVLCNLKEVASFEKKCHVKVHDLLERQKQLQQQIQVLEEREKDSVQKLKEADCMWSCMEERYKKKIAESMERQKNLLKQLKEAEASSIKWRKNKKDLDFQMDHISKCHQEIKQKINEKQSDIKCIDMEISNFKTHIESNKKDVEVSKKSLDNKKKASDREALLLEVDLLKESADQCKDKCKHKEDNIKDEIKALDKEIAANKVKCIQCHECTDTVDIRKFCTDCPRCISERDCLYENNKCIPDYSLDCVCTSVKQKFLDNVFDNMYSILERQIKTGPGKAVAEAVLNCLKKSRNGKINCETKKILQDFILTTIKKNLRLTVIGGALKTRCEMDKETYEQLMLCLKQVKVNKPVKADQGTDTKKEPCQRWGGTSECNCPNGPKQCVCTNKALPLIKEPTSGPPEKYKEDTGEVVSCPHKESTAFGVDCAMRTPSAVGFEVAQWRPDPCQEPTCQFKNMRAVQCVLGPEATSPLLGTKILGDQNTTCKCGSYETETCVCKKDAKYVKAGLDKTCDKNTCTSVFDQKTSVSLIEESKPTLIKETPNVDKKIDHSPQKHHKQHKISKNIDSNADDEQPTKIYLKDKIVSTKEIVEEVESLSKLTKVSPKVTKSSSEDMSMDISNKEDSSCKRYCRKNKRLSCSSLTKFLLKTSKQIESTCKKNTHQKTGKIYKVKVLGINNNREPLFALKEENSGQYKVLLDKEHEKYQKEMIKSYEGNNCKEFANLMETTSGHFTLDLNGKKEDAGKDALIVRSESGSLQVFTDKSKIAISLERDSVKSKSVISAHGLKRLLKKLPTRKSIYSNKSSNRLQMISIKSNSDSSLYEKVKFNIHNHHNLLIDPSVILRKMCSGEYTLVLSKESKKAFINNVKHYVSSSSKGQMPIRVTASGVIIVDVNTIRNNKKHYGSLKITPSGNIFVSLNDDSVKVLSKETVLDKVDPCSCKAISTTCNAQFEDGSCDKSKCVCKNICYKSKKWFYEHTATKSSITTKCGVDKRIDNIFDCFNICDSIESECLFRDHNERKLLHEDINNYSRETKLEHDFDDCYHVSEAVCPYHDEYENMAHESKIHITFKDSELIKTPIKEGYTKENIRHDWNSLKYLPPQLPQFLKDFTYS
ncbi:unnamed protein product, partial [Brenthis ino]